MYNNEAPPSIIKSEKNMLNPEQPLRRLDYPAWTNIVFNQIAEMLGGRCRFMVTGSAPLSQMHAEFMVVCFNLHLFEGFGMSETCAYGAV